MLVHFSKTFKKHFILDIRIFQIYYDLPTRFSRGVNSWISASLGTNEGSRIFGPAVSEGSLRTEEQKVEPESFYKTQPETKLERGFCCPALKTEILL